jgi:peptidoglycan/LPS O-acetylase OafA/YrhL
MSAGRFGQPASLAGDYLAHVDGLRALAVITVILYHLDARLIPGGFVGVDVFFVISGFVVTASLAGHRSETIGHFLGQFYARRLARLIPALVTVLLVTTLLYVLFVPKTWANRAADTTGLAAFWGLSNWSLDRQVINYFDARAEMNPFTHTWSLGVEEQFYLICPLMLFVALGAQFDTKRRQHAAWGIALLALVSLAACYYFGLTRGGRFVFFQITFRFWELAAGVLLYLAGAPLANPARQSPRLASWATAAGIALVAAAMLLPKPGAYPWVRSTIAVAGTVLLVAFPLMHPGQAVARLFGHPAAVWVGLRSYSLYLWHWPIFVIAGWTTGLNVWPFNLIALALTFVLATSSYYFIEKPVRYSRTLKSRHPMLRIGMFLVLVLAGWFAARNMLAQQPALGLGLPTREAPDWYADRDLLASTLADSRGCRTSKSQHSFEGTRVQLTTFVPEGCANRSTQQLFAVGDSHTGAFVPMLEQISAEHGRTVTVLDYPGCAYVDFMNTGEAAADASCAGSHRAMLKAVLAHAKRGDVVLLSSLRLPRLLEIGSHGRRTAQDIYARTPSELAGVSVASKDASLWVSPLLDAGLKVIFELPKPLFRVHPFQCVDWFNRHHPDCRPGLEESRQDQERYRAPTVDAIRALAANGEGIILWDPLPDLCDTQTCSALQNGRPLFFDGDHLSPYGNLVLLPSFRKVLSQAIDSGARLPPKGSS